MSTPAFHMQPRRQLRTEQIFAYAVGCVLVASGCVHTLVWLIDGTSWGGPVSWRKPILFGFSAGVTVISVGWVAARLRRRLGDSLLLTTFSVAMLLEVGLITVQQWRGVGSHFNRGTPFDASVLFWIECLVIFATIVIADLTWRSFQSLPAGTDMAIAIRGGMCLLLFSCLLGFLLVLYGNDRVAREENPAVFGAAGVMKFPHGVPLHAIQFLPMLVWLLKKFDVGVRERTVAVVAALSSVVTFTVFSLLQTFTGRSRFDLWWLSAAVLAGSAMLACVPLIIGVSASHRQQFKDLQ